MSDCDVAKRINENIIILTTRPLLLLSTRPLLLLYSFVGNNPLNGVDYLGLDEPTYTLPPITVGKNDVGLPSSWPSSGTLYEYTLNYWGVSMVFTPVHITGGIFSFAPPKPKTPSQKTLSKKACAELASKMANNVRTLSGMTETLSSSSVFNQIEEMLSSSTLYTNLGKDLGEFAYEQSKIGLDLNGLKSARKRVASIYKGGGATVLKGFGAFNDAMDIWALGNDLNDQDGLMFASHAVSVSLNFIGKIPGMGVPVATGKFIIEREISRTEEANDLLDISSKAAYRQEQSRNAAYGMANLKKWEKEFTNGGCK